MNKPYDFDTHATVKEFEEAGFNEKQAETQVRILKRLFVSNDIATKEDISRLAKEIQSTKNELEFKIDNLKHDLKSEIKSSASDLLKWVFGMIFLNTGILLAALRFFH